MNKPLLILFAGLCAASAWAADPVITADKQKLQADKQALQTAKANHQDTTAARQAIQADKAKLQADKQALQAARAGKKGGKKGAAQ